MLTEQRTSGSGDSSGVATVRRPRLPMAEWGSVRASFVPFAFAETVVIRDPLDSRVRISFTKHHGQATESFSDVSAVVRLPNGKDLAVYRLTGSLPTDVREHIQNVLTFAQSKEISPLQAARALWNSTVAEHLVAWVPERILDRARGETVVPPMSYAIPSFGEYLTNPEAATSRFFCAKLEGSNHVRLESCMSIDAGRVVLDLSMTDEDDKVTKQLFEIGTTKNRELCSDEEIRRDLLIQTYNAMEVLWLRGSEELQRYLLVSEAPPSFSANESLSREPDTEEERLVDTLIANGSIDLPSWDATYEMLSGARMHFGAGRHFALVTLVSDTSDFPAVYSWVFRDQEGDLSDPGNQHRQEILSAARQFATYDSDEVRLDAIQRLRALKAAIPMPVAAPLESIIGTNLADSLRAHSAVTIASVIPGDSEDIVRMSHGIHSIRLSLSDRKLKRTSPHLLDQIDVEFKPDGNLEIIGVNRLGGRVTAVVSRQALPESADRESFLHDLVDTMASQPSKGMRSVQRLLNDTVAMEDTGSWMSTSGDPYACALPTLHDIEGHRMYNVGTLFIKKYSEISCGNPDDCRLHSVGEGRVSVTLGLTSEPYQLTLLIDHGRVTRIEVTPNVRLDDTTYRPDYDRSRRYECGLSVMASQEDRSTLVRAFHLFDSLLSSLSFSGSGAVGVDFDRSELRSFLDRHFGHPRRHIS